MDTEKAIQDILEDLENQPLQESRTFRAYLNNPELISLSSTNATVQSAPISSQTNNAYYNFQVNLPRPALNVKSLQLLKAIIPQAQCSIPDYSLVFPYYKLACVPIDKKGLLYVLEDIDYTKIKYIRLLPSTNKSELIDIDLSANDIRNNFAYNRTFNDYEELLNELNKACHNDPLEAYDISGNFDPDDISFQYNQELNKFVFVGNNVSTPNTFGVWQEPFSYQEGVVVNYLGIDYLSLEASVGETPSTSPLYWLNVSQYYSAQPKFNTYLIAGYDDPNVDILLKYIEKRGTFLDQPWLTSIPANKYVKSQTLARRIGFTWDGNGMITDKDKLFLTQSTQIIYGSSIALFFNRFRPIPRYGFTIPPSLLSNPFAVFNLNNKYTADGYCNLVYSSIINIYTTIIGTSSVDTQRNGNLLAMIEFNAPNLGIAMANNFIDTKLTKIQNEIYSIYIELRDENGVEYYLTNNATTTLLLKLTY